MNETIIKRFNEKVKTNDIVYWLGDIGFNKHSELKGILSKIKGKHILIIGNHDKWGVQSYYNLGFCAVLERAEIRIGKNIVSLGHYPRRNIFETLKILYHFMIKMVIRKRRFCEIKQILKREIKLGLSLFSKWHLCGHCHNNWKIKGKNINVGVDNFDFYPVSIDKVAQIIERNNS